jgi:aspartate/methionine/tyrosine aminotransferase
MMNPLAEELNATLEEAAPALYGVLSRLGRELFFPRGILTQTAEAREKATKYNATIGIARQDAEAMHLGVIMRHLSGLSADEALDYAPSYGNPKLRKAWLGDMLAKNPSLAGKQTSLPVTTSGITHGLTISAEMFIDPGDIVIVPDKFWGNYNMVYGVRHQAVLRKFPMFAGNGFNTAGLRETLVRALDERGKAIVVLNFPNNPTGYSIRKDEADELTEAILSVAGDGRDVIVVLDDAYFGLFFTDDALRESLFGRLAQASEHVFPVKLDGATKEEYAWGLRVGFITFSVKCADGRHDEVHTALEKKVGGTVRGNISNCSQLSQSLVLAALSDADFEKQKQDKYEVMKGRARRVLEVLENPDYAPYWEAYPFNAGYFMCVALDGIDAEEFRLRLLSEYGVGVIADGPTDIRIAFSCLEIDEIADLFDIMYRCAREMKG